MFSFFRKNKKKRTALNSSPQNEFLEKYEVKKPDYDYIVREHNKMADLRFSPARYERAGEWWKAKENGEKSKIRIMVAGDITCFGRQLDDAKTDDGWDFNYEFDKVRPLFATSDLAVGNLETMVFPEAPFRSEKFVSEQQYHCNAPIEFLDAVRNAGFDLVTNANNHDMDTGAVGIGETIDHIEHFGLIQTGTFKSDKKHYELFDVNGFKIAIMAFATEHNNKRNNLTDEGIDFLLNDYSYENAKKLIDEARADGAETVIVCIHWGKEHKLVQNAEQEAMAKDLAEMGYDCIIGSHPHVLQPFDILTANGKSVPVFYSMGNFVSHNADNKKARAIIACVDLVRGDNGIDIECSYIPVITSKNYGEKRYVVLPIKENSVDEKNLENLDLIVSVMGEKLPITADVEHEEYIERKTADKKKKSGAKKAKPDPATAEKLPINYGDSSFRYNVFRDYAVIEKFSPEASTSSFSVPAKVLGVPVVQLKDNAFANSKSLKKINFGKNMDVVNAGACKGCTSLEGFQLGRSIKTVGTSAFEGCSKLACAVMRESVEEIGSRAFANCKGLRSVKLPKNVVKIADDAFAGSAQATFYCEKDSYGEKYAREHGYKVINMKF